MDPLNERRILTFLWISSEKIRGNFMFLKERTSANIKGKCNETPVNTKLELSAAGEKQKTQKTIPTGKKKEKDTNFHLLGRKKKRHALPQSGKEFHPREGKQLKSSSIEEEKQKEERTSSKISVHLNL